MPNDMPDLVTRKALVTGGTTGLGESIALQLQADGYEVGVCGQRADKLAAMQERGVHTIACDVGDMDQVAQMGRWVAGQWKRLDLLVNCAGIALARSDFSEVSLADAERVLRVNLLGTIAVTQVMQPFVIAAKGSIVNISSTLAQRPRAGSVVYSASKGVSRRSAGRLRSNWPATRYASTAWRRAWYAAISTSRPACPPAPTTNCCARAPAKVLSSAWVNRSTWPAWWRSWVPRLRPGRQACAFRLTAAACCASRARQFAATSTPRIAAPGPQHEGYLHQQRRAAPEGERRNAQHGGCMMSRADIYAAQGFGGSLGPGQRWALLLVDFTVGFVDPALFGGADIEAAAKQACTLLAFARHAALPVAHSRVGFADDGSDAGLFAARNPRSHLLSDSGPGSQFLPSLVPASGELVIRKTVPSAFFSTGLAPWLAARGVDTLLVAGCTTSGCVRASVVDAISHNLRPVVVVDCVGDRAQAPHQANLFDMRQKYADLMSCAEVVTAFEAMRAGARDV